MDMQTVRARAAGGGRLLATLVALAVPPVLLATVVGNPLPSWPIDWADVAARLEAGLVPLSVWVDVLAVVAWTAWTILMVMLAAELVVVVRDRPSRTGVPIWVRRLAQLLISAAVAVAGPAQPTATAAGEPTIVAAAAPAHDRPAPVDRPSPASPQGRLVTVGEGDSWAGFAADVVRDPSLGQALRDANLGRWVDGVEITEATAFVEPGWQVLIPTDLDPQPDATPAPTARPTPDRQDRDSNGETDAVVKDEGGTVEVGPGDHFWKIAEQTLAEAWGQTPSDVEVAGYWTELVDANRDRLLPPGDPDLIYPGQQLITPPAPTEPNVPSDASEAPTEASDTPDEPPAGVAADEADPAAPIAPADRTEGTASGWRAAITGQTDPADADSDVTDPDEEPTDTVWGVSPMLPSGLAASSLLAAGVTAMIRRRRRLLLMRRQPGMRLPTPAPEVTHELGRLHAAAPPDEVLDDLVGLLCSIPQDVYPAAVTTSDDGTVELLFDDDTVIPDPVAPWASLERDNMPVGWIALVGDTGPTRSYGLPLLVTVGRSKDKDVHLNLGAIRSLIVAGDQNRASRLLHQFTMEVASSPVSGPVEVAVAGDQRMASWYRVRTVDDGTPVVEQAVAEQDSVSVHDRMPQLLVCHPGTEPPPVPDGLDGMVGTIAATDQPDADGWILDIQSATTGRLHRPAGAMVDLDLPDVDTQRLEQEITTLDDALAAQSAPPTADAGATFPPGDRPDVHDEEDTTTAGTLVEFPDRDHARPWCDVQLLGPVRVLLGGEIAQDVRNLPLQVLTYLVTHPGGVTLDQLDNDVWDLPAGRDSHRAKAAIIRLRGLLGDGPDGEPLLPTRSPGERDVVLSDHVGCDGDRALALVDRAKDLHGPARLRELEAALDLVRGGPFQGEPMSWTTEYSQRLITRLQDAALEVAEARRKAGDHDAAEDVIHRAISLCPYTESVYAEWARIEVARGHLEQVPQIRDRLSRLGGRAESLEDVLQKVGTTKAAPGVGDSTR